MNYSENALNLLAAKTYKGIGRAWIIKNWDSSKSVAEIVAKLNKDSKESDIVAISDFERVKQSIAAEIDQLQESIDGVVALGDSNFPTHRGNVKNSEKPIYLFYRGNLSLLDTSHTNIAVIGALEPDAEIEELEKKVVAELVLNDVVIVSGLANGCDSIAHKQTLASGGKTVAILPSALNKVLPRSNESLAQEIVENEGLLVSEYWKEPASRRELIGRYHERDRLQALFSDGIILSASYSPKDKGKDSGSRLAMGFASDYSLPRAVMYDETKHSDNPLFNLNREILSADRRVTVINEGNIKEKIATLISYRKSPRLTLF